MLLKKTIESSTTRALSLLRPRSATAPLSCWDPTLTYCYVHAIEPSDRLHSLHCIVDDDEMMRSVLYKMCLPLTLKTVFPTASLIVQSPSLSESTCFTTTKEVG
jgi:hypothetical protein